MAFLGRERELAQLAEAVRRVAQGSLGRVVLTGPAGIGCTRLLDELSARRGGGARRGGLRAVGPTRLPWASPTRPFGAALAGTLAALPDERLAHVVGPAGHDLCLLVPGLAERLDALGIDRRAPSLIAPDQVGRRVVESILGTIERLAAGGLAAADPGGRPPR